MSQPRRSARVAAKVVSGGSKAATPSAPKKVKSVRNHRCAERQAVPSEEIAMNKQRITNRIQNAFNDLAYLPQWDELYEATVKYLFALTDSKYFNLLEWDLDLFYELIRYADDHEYMYDDRLFYLNVDKIRPLGWDKIKEEYDERDVDFGDDPSTDY